jgi:thioredoxin reductase
LAYDVVIVGGGAAGLSAALVLGRARRSVIVLDNGHPRNAVVDASHGFVTRDGAAPAELLRIARAQLNEYATVSLLSATASTAVKRVDGFSVTTASGETYNGKRLLIATGVFDALPEISGLPERWGKSVFVCPFCDGWEVRDQPIGVYGKGRDAVDLAREIHGWTKDIVVCVESDDLQPHDRRWIEASGTRLKVGRVRALDGQGGTLSKLLVEGGEAIPCTALFVCAPLVQHSPLFRDLGCKIGADGLIAVNASACTSVAGCYAAGDSVTKHHQIVIAAASGAAAAIAVSCNLLETEARELAATRRAT